MNRSAERREATPACDKILWSRIPVGTGPSVELTPLMHLFFRDTLRGC